MLSGGPSMDSKATVGPRTIAIGVAPCGAVVQPAAPRPNSPAARSPTRIRCKTLRDAPAARPPPVIPIQHPRGGNPSRRNVCLAPVVFGCSAEVDLVTPIGAEVQRVNQSLAMRQDWDYDSAIALTWRP